MILEFRGSSDDTFGWDKMTAAGKRIGGDDHDDCANFKVRAFLVESPTTGRVLVTGVYGKCIHGTWSVGLAPVDEDEPWPEWAALPRFRADGYTPVLQLLVPDDTTVTLSTVDGKVRSAEDDE